MYSYEPIDWHFELALRRFEPRTTDTRSLLGLPPSGSFLPRGRRSQRVKGQEEVSERESHWAVFTLTSTEQMFVRFVRGDDCTPRGQPEAEADRQRSTSRGETIHEARHIRALSNPQFSLPALLLLCLRPLAARRNPVSAKITGTARRVILSRLETFDDSVTWNGFI